MSVWRRGDGGVCWIIGLGGGKTIGERLFR